MTDRPPTPDDDTGMDAGIERRLRAAFGAAPAPEVPASVHAEVARLVASPSVRTRPRIAGWPSPGWIAVVLALSAILIGSLFAGGSSPAPTVPSGSAEASSEIPTPIPSGAASGACDVSPGTMHGTWWREIGGPNAFFNWEAEPRRLERTAPWKLIVRFDPDVQTGEVVSVMADNLETGERAVGAFNSRMDPANIYNLDSAAPDLPGGLYLFEQPLPSPGCWRLSAAIGGRVAGTAVVEVIDLAAPSPTPDIGPTPASEPTPWPGYTLAPAADNVLPLAGRNGLPGEWYCSHHRFGIEGLTAPTGAEDRVGPEYDVLRESIALDGPSYSAEAGPDPTFREAGRDAGGVVFLYDRLGPGPIEGGPYLYIEEALGENGWRWEGSGDCQPRAVAPSGYGQAIWTLDPAFRAPTQDARTLHILVQELACVGGQSASGRISPAFVTTDRHQVVIEAFVEALPDEGDCVAARPTPARLRLPEPLGDRTLFDAGTIGLGGSGG